MELSNIFPISNPCNQTDIFNLTPDNIKYSVFNILIIYFTGVCPQHDILFDSLSAREHLVIFATIKGIPNDQINAAVDRTLEDITLMEKASTRATDLSGGQKRKLSVGIAIIGDPKVLLT